MNIDEMYPSRWLKAEHVTTPTIATIRDVTVEEMQTSGDTKPVVYFMETEMGLVLNKTNANMITAILKSNDTDVWKGKSIGLRQEMVSFQGKPTPSIRVFDPAPPKAGGFGKKAATVVPVDDVPTTWETHGKETEAIPDPGDPVRAGSHPTTA